MYFRNNVETGVYLTASLGRKALEPGSEAVFIFVLFDYQLVSPLPVCTIQHRPLLQMINMLYWRSMGHGASHACCNLLKIGITHQRPFCGGCDHERERKKKYVVAVPVSTSIVVESCGT